jgi:hypothetical protein
MNKIKLPSMVEYVVRQRDNDRIDLAQRFINSFEFANFLSQQPNIGMFVPAVFEDGEWRVLSKPKGTNVSTSSFFEMQTDYLLENQYQTALDNVIFEGCEYNDKELFLDGNLFWVFLNELKFEEGLTIEQLTSHNLTLTPKFAKELGLI